MPTRIDGNLFEAARVAGERNSRSAAQQLDHWARIGRELETSPSVTHHSIEGVLSGNVGYDTLGEQAQAIVRAEWDVRISAKIAGLNFEEQLTKAGKPWAEADGAGALKMHGTPSSAQ